VGGGVHAGQPGGHRVADHDRPLHREFGQQPVHLIRDLLKRGRLSAALAVRGQVPSVRPYAVPVLAIRPPGLCARGDCAEPTGLAMSFGRWPGRLSSRLTIARLGGQADPEDHRQAALPACGCPGFGPGDDQVPMARLHQLDSPADVGSFGHEVSPLKTCGRRGGLYSCACRAPLTPGTRSVSHAMRSGPSALVAFWRSAQARRNTRSRCRRGDDAQTAAWAPSF
jgi:hypothetical protein